MEEEIQLPVSCQHGEMIVKYMLRPGMGVQI